jgi:hypothetical protein
MEIFALPSFTEGLIPAQPPNKDNIRIVKSKRLGILILPKINLKPFLSAD